MAKNTNVHCVRVINGLKVKSLGTKVVVDVFVVPTKEEGYPMILERPWLWLIEMKQKKGLVHRIDQALRMQKQGDPL